MIPMNKKVYEMPVVKKVHLEIKNSVLSVCHSSMVGDAQESPFGCRCAGATCAIGDPASLVCPH